MRWGRSYGGGGDLNGGVGFLKEGFHRIGRRADDDKDIAAKASDSCRRGLGMARVVTDGNGGDRGGSIGFVQEGVGRNGGDLTVAALDFFRNDQI